MNEECGSSIKQIWIQILTVPFTSSVNLGETCLNIYFFLFKIYFIQVYLIYNVVLISAVSQSDSVIYIHIYIHTHIYIHILFFILLFIASSQDFEYSSLWYTVGPYYLSILYKIVFNC